MAEWVELRRYDDNLEAEIALNFLRDHGVRVKLLGNSGQTSVLNRFSTIVDIRLMVPKNSIKRARSTLEAMTDALSGVVEVERVPENEEDPQSTDGHPYRGAHGKKEEERPRYRRAALVLAFLLPIGSGHIYARHDTTGGVVAIAMVGMVLASVLSREAWFLGSCLVLVLCDAFGSLRAVREHNDGAMPSHETQLLRGLAYLGIAIGAGLVAHLVGS